MPAARLSTDKRALILAALCEGSAINSVCRMFKVGKHAVLRLIEETGLACEDYHNRVFRGLEIARLELDEQWGFVHTHKERMSKAQKQARPDRGDCWLWAGIDPESKAVISWRTGKRTVMAARNFATDLASRIEGRVQITTDDLQAYRFSLPGAFGQRADIAVETKKFQNVRGQGHEFMKHRVNPLVGVDREVVAGNPDLRTATVCHAERFFLTIRQSNKRVARKTLAYSKSWQNHSLATSMHVFVYNFVRRHETTKQTPAQALGVADKRWTLEDVVDMTDAFIKAREEAKFLAAFERAPKFVVKPRARVTYTPTPKDQIPLPWYLRTQD